MYVWDFQSGRHRVATIGSRTGKGRTLLDEDDLRIGKNDDVCVCYM